MATRRKDDTDNGRSKFRTDRIVQDSGKWYFHTREGTIEGPFVSRVDAILQLARYVELARNNMLARKNPAVELEVLKD